MFLKCYFETAGNIVSRVVYAPASQSNISSDLRTTDWRLILSIYHARYRQALRHMWGALDTGFAVRRTISYTRFRRRCLLLRPRHFHLFLLLWEAHFLPCYLTILLVFSTLYEHCTPTTSLSPAVTGAFWFTNLLRISSFVLMNCCLSLYERWHGICVRSRRFEMQSANVSNTGYSDRTWWHLDHLFERICFPIAGTIFGSIPAAHAVLSHFWTDRLVYRVSKKPVVVASGQIAVV